MKRPARVPSQLSESLHQRLNSYALAASAAGVGMLAIVPPAVARIIYTPTHHRIEVNTFYTLDLNHDGTPDFIISNWVGSGEALSVCPENPGRYCAAYRGRPANDIWGHPSPYDRTKGWASALPAGFKVGPNDTHLHRGHFLMAGISQSGGWGDWLGRQPKYLGFKFFIHGKAHYGWAHVNVTLNSQSGLVGTLSGYAYETIPNKPIITGKTHGRDEATLGRLAQGASGIVREKK
jgi:hypothetical protein